MPKPPHCGANPRSTRRPAALCPAGITAGVTLLAALLYVWGIRRNLPYTPEVDEPIFVGLAVSMVAEGRWNPGWFGNPGSTLIYPLALLYRIAWQPAQIAAAFAVHPAPFYWIGRTVSIVAAVAAVPVVYRAGILLFSPRVAGVGVLFLLSYSLVPSYVQKVRTDGVAYLFAAAALWAMARLWQRPSSRRYLLAGALIGLGAASRYFLVLLLPASVAIALTHAVTERRWARHAGGAALVVGATLLAFAASTPFFLLDFDTAWQNLRFEAREEQVGADGLSFWGNMAWYVGHALPATASWPQVALMAAGGGLALVRRHRRAIWLSGLSLLFLCGLSLAPLHWARWMIPALPCLALLAAFALCAGVERLAPARAPAVLLALALLLVAAPLWQTVQTNSRHSRATTRVLARHWMVAHLPPGGRVLQEHFTVPLTDTAFAVEEVWDLTARGPAETLRGQGIDYVVAKENRYSHYLADPARYPAEHAFYDHLFAEGSELARFRPDPWRGGPELRIIALPAAE